VPTRRTPPSSRRPDSHRPDSRRPHGPPRQRVRPVIIAVIGLVAFLAALWFVVRVVAPWISSSGTTPFASVPTVTKVIDGDTIDVRVGRKTIRIRLVGIDTPETKDPRKPVQCFGKEASDRTSALLPVGTEVRLERDVEELDAFGRTLAYVFRSSDGLFVNLSLAQDGFADTLRIAPNTAHAAEFTAAVAAARDAQLGLWKACGGPGRPVR
jgi:micrococcal nuclease